MDDDKVRKWFHDLNNRVGIILANAELIQLEKPSPRVLERSGLIEEKSLEIRQLIRDLADHVLQ